MYHLLRHFLLDKITNDNNTIDHDVASKGNVNSRRMVHADPRQYDAFERLDNQSNRDDAPNLQHVIQLSPLL